MERSLVLLGRCFSIIVLGGGICSTLVAYKISEFAKIMKVAVKVWWKRIKTQDTIKMLIELIKARREGLLPEADQENM